MRPKTVTVTGSNDPYIIPLNYRVDDATLHVEVTGTINYTISYTTQNIHSMSDPATNADWIAVTDMTAVTATATNGVYGSINAIKVVVNSGAGSVDVTVSQSSGA